MGTTARGFRYPEATDRVNLGHVAIANLAADVQDEFDATLGAGSGTRVTLSATGKLGANITVPTFSIVRQGVFRHLTLYATYGGATITADSKGNIADLPVLTAGGIPAGDYRTSGDLYVYGVLPGVCGLTFRIETTGAVTVTDLSGAAGQTIVSSNQLRLDATYSAV